MILRCIETVIMHDDGSEAFIKGQRYTMYQSQYKTEYKVHPCICSKNNSGDRHIIVSKELGNQFFKNHFEIVALNNS